MQAVSHVETSEVNPRRKSLPVCYHCGLACLTANIAINDKYFCCEGCKLVYEILNTNDLCDYYNLQSHPGISQVKPLRNDKYSFLDNEAISKKLIHFGNPELAIVTFYIPSIHCSSCMWLLEHLNRMDSGIIESRISFSAKEVTIHFKPGITSLRKIVELLATIGYEPCISLEDTNEKSAKTYNKQRIVKLGIAGFCFGNIMMMSFPEYLAGKVGIEVQYTHMFRYLNLLLSLPVFFYSATEFYSAAWAGLKQRILNIDAPIVLALAITFSRSIYEIITNTGAGYLDSMSGIVFFMLAGRVLQERTYKSLSFTRDYKSYFPIAVNVRNPAGDVPTQLNDLKENDVVVLYNDEIIPADSLVLNNNALIDYSFVSGEADPVIVKQGEIVYAGGKQTGRELLIRVVRPVAVSYLTSLWNHYAFKKNVTENNDGKRAIHILSRYFTAILFGLTAITAAYWYFHDPSKIVNSVSAMLIVACPCALLLSATFTNSNILRILGLNGLYLRDATVIEQMADIDHVVFDKTGTLTKRTVSDVVCYGYQLASHEKDILYSIVRQSNHPVSKALEAWLGKRNIVPLTSLREVAGGGIQASCAGDTISVGSYTFTGAENSDVQKKAAVYVKFNDGVSAINLQSPLRNGIPELISEMTRKFSLSLLSGDNDRQRPLLGALFGKKVQLLFEQRPVDKLNYIEKLQRQGAKVMMVGDGLNDAGALRQSNVGVSLADDINNFTPACDAILNAKSLNLFTSLLGLAGKSGYIIRVSFVISIIYNIAGLYVAMQGQMKPVVAAILMPCSTLSIVIISSGLSNLIAWRKGLTVTSGK